MPTVIQGQLYVATETAQGVGGKQTQKIPPESVSTRQDGYVVQLAANVVQNNITIPNVDTTLRQIVLSTIPGMYGEIRVRAYGYILFSATSTLQDISLKLRQAGVSFVGANVEIVRTPSAALAKIPWYIENIKIAPFDTTYDVSVSAPAADANTSAYFNGMFIEGIGAA